jgi:SNF family Na+-dependent transporter
MPTTAMTSNTNKKLLISAGAAIAVATAITVYYLLIPAWIIVIRGEEDENALPSIENRFKIADDDLAELPSLREAMARVNGNYPL